MVDLGAGRVAHRVAGLQQARGDVGVLAADDVFGEAADGRQGVAAVGGERVGTEAGLDPQFRGVGQALAAAFRRVVEAPRLGTEQAGAGVRQLAAVGHADVGLGIEFVEQVGETVGRGGNGVLGQVDQRVGLDLLAGPAPRPAVVEAGRLDDLDPRAEGAEALHRVVAGAAVHHQDAVRLPPLRDQGRQQPVQVRAGVARGNDQGAAHQAFFSSLAGARP